MKSSGVKSNTVSLSVPIQAKYDKAFYCTGYYTSLESDWSGEKVAVDSLGNDAYKKAFLEDTKMNGSGKAENGNIFIMIVQRRRLVMLIQLQLLEQLQQRGEQLLLIPIMFRENQ